MKVMISCDEATAICDKNQYGEASFLEKFSLMFHLFICKYCKKYTKQNNLMSTLFGKYLTACDGTEKLSKEEKAILKKECEKALKEK